MGSGGGGAINGVGATGGGVTVGGAVTGAAETGAGAGGAEVAAAGSGAGETGFTEARPGRVACDGTIGAGAGGAGAGPPNAPGIAASRPIRSDSRRATWRLTSAASAPSARSRRRLCAPAGVARSDASRTPATSRTAARMACTSKPS